MGYRARLRVGVAALTTAVLALVVLYPPWRVFVVTPKGAVAVRVEFSFISGSGAKSSAGGMYPQRSVIAADLLALEIVAVVMIGGLLLLVVRRENRIGQREDRRSTRAADRMPGVRADLEVHPEYQSSPGESFEQHAARLDRIWGASMPGRAPGEPAGARGSGVPGSPAPSAPPPVGSGDVEPPIEFQSSPGEPFDQHAERLKRVWRSHSERKPGEPERGS